MRVLSSTGVAFVCFTAKVAVSFSMEIDTSAMYSPTLLEGDIEMGYSMAALEYGSEAANSMLKAGLLRDEGRSLGAGEPGFNKLWTGGVVRYAPLSGGFTTVEYRNLILGAMTEITQRTGIQFEEASASCTKCIYFQNGGGCSSYIGMIGRQAVTLKIPASSVDPHCMFNGIIIHELMHALGFFHEHSNFDRDNFVTINFGNIQAEREHNFNKREATRSLGVEYDIESIMHYSSRAFSSNGQPTIVPNNPNANSARMGQRDEFRVSDQLQLQLFYHCAISNPGQTTPIGAYGVKALDTSGSSKLCSPTCPCHAGQGHCSSDADCLGNLVCKSNVGAYSYLLSEPYPVPGLSVCGQGQPSGPTAPPVPTPTAPLPTPLPSASPTRKPTSFPTRSPTTSPTRVPTSSPSLSPTTSPTQAPTPAPSAQGEEEENSKVLAASAEEQAKEDEVNRIVAFSVAGVCGLALVGGMATWQVVRSKRRREGLPTAAVVGFPDDFAPYGKEGGGGYQGGRSADNPLFGA